MLNSIELKFFKCFKDVKLDFAPLTLLTGQNASGKSTIIQAIVLLHQTMQGQEWATRLLLNGRELQLGTVSDIVDSVNGRDSIEISLSDSVAGAFKWVFSGESREDMSMQLKEFAHNGGVCQDLSLMHYLLPLSVNNATGFSSSMRNLTYITAERIGPRQLYALADRYNDEYSGVGKSGEYAANVLYKLGHKEVLSGLLCHSSTGSSLTKQVRAWMEVFFPHSDLEITSIPEANSIRMGFRNSQDTGFHRPINVGFGMTQVFPIVVAVLAANKDDIVIIENPEVHLHPAGQAQMGNFLARAATAGVQIIIESHSDHILNGIRKSVKQKIISPDRVAIHFFKSRIEAGDQVISLHVSPDGTLDDWPKDFFDQFDKDMNFLAGWNE